MQTPVATAVAVPVQPVPVQPVLVQPVQVQAMPVQPVPMPVETVSAPLSQGIYYPAIPVQITCVHCKQVSTTRVSTETGLGTWLMCLGLCCIGCDLGCCFIPFCVDAAKDKVHTCSSCGQVVGINKVIG
mmetsp:Transcript_33831/g.55858  ORF Transcript_33831/g.55858 Transcript_33831/m.55858 type:complete len:129 (+) Transcript_33831:20-406(+)